MSLGLCRRLNEQMTAPNSKDVDNELSFAAATLVSIGEKRETSRKSQSYVDTNGICIALVACDFDSG